MKLKKRDWLVIAGGVGLLALLILSTGKDKAGRVPFDEKHRPFYEALKKGDSRMDVEKGCSTCHKAQGVPLPDKHPPKEQCLICHKLLPNKT